MLPDYEIVLGRGIGNILLGITKEELVELLGDPDDIELPEDPERTDWETYSYDVIKCSFSFDPDRDDRLVELTVENGYFHILHKIRVGMRKEDVLKSVSGLNFGDLRTGDKSSEELPTHELLSFDKVGLNLWLDDGCISSIQILSYAE